MISTVQRLLPVLEAFDSCDKKSLAGKGSLGLNRSMERIFRFISHIEIAQRIIDGKKLP